METFLKFTFFIFAVPAIMWELYVLFHLEETFKFKKNFVARVKNKEKANSTETTYSILQLLYWVWCIVGLFSSQWILFILHITLGFIVRGVNHFVLGLNALLSIVVLTFMVINAFHLHINLLELVKSFVM